MFVLPVCGSRRRGFGFRQARHAGIADILLTKSPSQGGTGRYQQGDRRAIL